jgi:sigma-E factor negative regulatory protein RseA
MNTESREHISCLMDGEVSRETGRFLVRRLGADEELCATWARYHLVRDCLRHQEGGLASESLAARIRHAIAQESPSASQPVRVRRWFKPAVGMAVAASVALMAIVAVGPGRQPAPVPGSDSAGVAEAPAFRSPRSLTMAPVSQQVSLLGESAGDSRMNALLLRHYQATGATGGKGFVTFVPIVLKPAAASAEVTEQSPEAGQQAEEEGSASRR